MKSSTRVFIGKRYDSPKRGSFTVTRRFCERYHETFLNEDEVINPKELFENNHVISTFQSPKMYVFKFDLLQYRNYDATFYIREPINKILKNSVTNGYNMYKNNNYFKKFIPMITDFPSINKYNHTPTIGFYARMHTNPDAIDYFRKDLNNLKYPIDVVLMGDNIEIANKNVKSVFHTFDEIEFFTAITHYYFPKSAIFVDPFPNALLEAIQCNKQVICPTIPGRKHTDGIEDILSTIEGYFTDINAVFSEKEYSLETCLCEKFFDKFNKELLANNFDYEQKPSNSLLDWCAKHNIF